MGPEGAPVGKEEMMEKRNVVAGFSPEWPQGSIDINRCFGELG
jgi:hypothetical protein